MKKRYLMTMGKAGTVAGVIAGIVTSLTAMIVAMFSSLDFWLPMKQISAIFLGESATEGDMGIIATGLVIHLAMSAIYGFLFGVIFPALRSTSKALLAGILYGIGIWALSIWAWYPIISSFFVESTKIASSWWFIHHVIFGAVLSLTPHLVSSRGNE